jgi:hypothetical protein
MNNTPFKHPNFGHDHAVHQKAQDPLAAARITTRWPLVHMAAGPHAIPMRRHRPIAALTPSSAPDHGAEVPHRCRRQGAAAHDST